MRTTIFAAITLFGFIIIFIICNREITPDAAIDAIVGEASNQSYDTMVCIAQGIRHRGTLRGVYGRHARHNTSESTAIWSAAESAWDESAIAKDKINGAKNWGTVSDLIKLGIHAGDLKAYCGDFYFY